MRGGAMTHDEWLAAVWVLGTTLGVVVAGGAVLWWLAGRLERRER